jgi:hypothetical protein
MQTMNQPTKKQMQTVIDNLKKIEDLANNPKSLNMMEYRVQSITHDCGTVHCVAGWYVVAIRDNDDYIKSRIKSKKCHFHHGAYRIAETLGFETLDELEEWAEDNPEIWGNQDGSYMFSEESAYNGMAERTDKMSCVIEHLEGVRDRLLG